MTSENIPPAPAEYFCRFGTLLAPSKVNCVDIGRRSRQVLATGNADRDVSLFSMHKREPIMTLTGHTSPVESVKFEESEEIVLAGSLGGVIKAWDLGTPKFICSLRGHAGPVKSLDTYGPHYVASGSVDSSVKIWDMRIEGSCFTYAGHEKTVGSVAFSPNGSWLVSSSSDGTAKLWDLLAGKMLHEFTNTRFGMTCAVFHPQELLLATASSGGEVRFFDLEHFAEISCVRIPGLGGGGQSSSTAGVWSLYFDHFGGDHPSADAGVIYALSPGRLSVIDWEPPRITGQIPYDLFSPQLLAPQLISRSASTSNPQHVLVDVVDNSLGAYLLPRPILSSTSNPTMHTGGSYAGMSASNSEEFGGNPEAQIRAMQQQYQHEQVGAKSSTQGDTARSGAQMRSSRRSFTENGRPGHPGDLHLKLNPRDPTADGAGFESSSGDDRNFPDHDKNAIFVPSRTIPRSPVSQKKMMLAANQVPPGQADTSASGTAASASGPVMTNFAALGGARAAAAIPPGRPRHLNPAINITGVSSATSASGGISPGKPLASSTPNPINNSADQHGNPPVRPNAGAAGSNNGNTGSGFFGNKKSTSQQNSSNTGGLSRNNLQPGGGAGSVGSSSSGSSVFPTRDHASPRARTIATVIPQRPQCTSGTQTTPKSTPDASPKLEDSSPEEESYPGGGPGTSFASYGGYANSNSYSGLNNASGMGGNKADLLARFSTGVSLSDPDSGSLQSTPSPGMTYAHASPKHLPHGQLSVEDDASLTVRRDAGVTLNAMAQRAKLWNHVMTVWRKEGARGAFDYATMSGNEQFEADLLALLGSKRSLWTLDVCTLALPRLRYFMTTASLGGAQGGDPTSGSGFSMDDDDLVYVAIPCLRIILRDFAAVLKNGIRSGAPDRIGVDITQEARREKCLICMRELGEIKQWLGGSSGKRRGNNNVFLNEISLLLRCID